MGKEKDKVSGRVKNVMVLRREGVGGSDSLRRLRRVRRYACGALHPYDYGDQENMWLRKIKYCFNRVSVAQEIENLPLDLQRPFYLGFKPRYWRSALTEDPKA
ncbi:hypothetical protein PoB_005651300 [Plakobranchus ocellatus]|uniref:Uncharacterized protein n=1 Tax=Plakobranchus ocellatus TaxID=259542 RepID=A0AAV4CDM0_9GAST|nr:hypothetical protein PoB_005651300 [Plakobranchus ocellatus]